MIRAGGAGIAAVLFDLDDTLFPQQAWLRGAWEAVARTASGWGIDHTALSEALVTVAAEGSDRGRIIDRALEAIRVPGAPEVPVGDLVAAFRAHRPSCLEAYPGVHLALARLGAAVRLGLVSDGDVEIQQAKLDALGLTSAFDVVVFSDALGRDRRKPDPAPFLLALHRLGQRPDEAVFVGDRPQKDIAGARAAGMRAIRVLTGEYSAAPDHPQAWMTVPGMVEATYALLGLGLDPDGER